MASPAWAATFTATAAVGSAVTMDDPTGSVTFTITNTTAGPARFIDRVRFYFTRTQYFIARGTTAPTNWRVAAISNPAAGAESYVEFRANNAAARIAPGASLSFTVMLQGTSYANLPRSAADATDLNTRVRSRDNTGLWTNQTGVAPSWARKALALTFQPSPLGLGPGQALALTAQIENRSTAAQATSVVANPTGGCGSSPNPPCPNFTGSASLSSLTGPTPASRNLLAGRQDAIDWTYTAGSGTGTVYFRGRAQNGATATSIDVSSPTVTIAALTASLSLDPASVISGGETVVRLDVTNGGISTTLGNITPTITAPGGSTLLSGPTPTTFSSLAVGATASFLWRYRITGATGSTFTFQASASATSPAAITSNTATASGTIGSLVVTTSPSVVASATTPLSLAFTLSNRTGAALRSVCMYQPNATFTAAYTSGSSACGSWTVAPFGGARPGVRFTANNNPSRIANGGSCVFTVNYSSAPTVTKDTDYVFQFDGLTGTTCSAGYRGTAYGRLTVTEYAIALTHAPAAAPADGTSQITLTATLTRAGSPLANRTIAFTTTAGKLSSGTAVTNASGQAQVILTAPSSSTAVTASLTATYLKAVGRDSVLFSAFSGPNLQYVGGSLSPLATGVGCTGTTFRLCVRNDGAQATTLTLVSTTFAITGLSPAQTPAIQATACGPSCVGACANDGDGEIDPGERWELTYQAATTPGTAGSYTPTLVFVGTNIVGSQTRTASDPVTIAGSCSTTGQIRILDWREIVR